MSCRPCISRSSFDLMSLVKKPIIEISFGNDGKGTPTVRRLFPFGPPASWPTGLTVSVRDRWSRIGVGSWLGLMARQLKTFQTSLGFFDLAIAAPSMKAALE